MQGEASASSGENFLQRSPSKRRWIFDSLKTYALFYSGVSVNEIGIEWRHLYIKSDLS